MLKTESIKKVSNVLSVVAILAFSQACSVGVPDGQLVVAPVGSATPASGASPTPTPEVPKFFISKWKTMDNNEAITLPINSSEATNILVDWGDGTEAQSGEVSHAYASAGDYTISITGTLTSINFKTYNTSKDKIIEVIELGNLGWTDLSDAFYECENLTSFKGGDTSRVTNMNRMFYGTSALKSVDLSSFDTANVTDMSWMFATLYEDKEGILGSVLESLDLSSFDTKKVTRMDYMFAGALSLKSLDLSKFNTKNVTTMEGMFAMASLLTSLDLSSFDTVNVTNMSSMFWNASSLTSLDLSKFNTKNVTTMKDMFASASSLTSLDLSSFDTTNVTDMNCMFYSYSASSLASIILSSKFNTGNVTDMGGMFYGASSLTSIDLSSFNTENVTRMDYMFAEASSLTLLDLSKFKTDKVTTMEGMFDYTTSLTSLNVNGWNVSNVATYYPARFQGSLESLKVYCDQGGNPGTGTFYGKTCLALP